MRGASAIFAGVLPTLLCAVCCGDNPTPEARAVWWHFENINPDPAAGKAAIDAFVQRVARANMNLILPWVHSDYIAALDDPKYQQTYPAAKWDSLGCLIDAADKQGIQVHIWYSFTYYKNRNCPEFATNSDWAAVREDELVPDKEGKTTPRRWADVCNLHPEARTFTLSLLEKVLKRYPKLRGIHIEEPGFGYRGNCLCPLCQEAFPKIYGFDLKGKTESPEAMDMKCLATTDFMRRLRAMMLEKDKSLVLSANGGYYWVTERASGRDWGIWAKHGWLDYYAAQIYVASTEDLKKRGTTTVGDIGHDTQVYIGINISPPAWRKPTLRLLSPAELCEFIGAIRSTGASGIVVFYGNILSDAHAEALRTGPFKDRAPLPLPRRLCGQ